MGRGGRRRRGRGCCKDLCGFLEDLTCCGSATLADKAVATFSAGLGAADILTDVAVTLDFQARGHTGWATICFVILLLGPVVNGFTSCWNGRRLDGFLSLTHLGLVVGWMNVMFSDRRSDARMGKRDIERYKTQEVIWESIPEVGFQGYVLMMSLTGLVGADGSTDCSAGTCATDVSDVQLVSFGISIVMIAVTLTTIRRQTSTWLQSTKKANPVLLIVWSLVEVVSRVLAVAVFAAQYKGYAFIALGVEYVLLFVWMLGMRYMCDDCCDGRGSGDGDEEEAASARRRRRRGWIAVSALGQMLSQGVFLSPLTDTGCLLIRTLVVGVMLLGEPLGLLSLPSDGDPLAPAPLLTGGVCWTDASEAFSTADCPSGLPSAVVGYGALALALHVVLYFAIVLFSRKKTEKEKAEDKAEAQAAGRKSDGGGGGAATETPLEELGAEGHGGGGAASRLPPRTQSKNAWG